MRKLTGFTMLGTLVATAATAAGQPPDDGARPGADSSVASTIARMMRYDKNKDGKLTKAELSDQRLRRLFDRADSNKDGTVTKEELTALASEWQQREGQGPPGFGGGPGFGPPGGFPPRGGGPGGMMGGPPPRPGEVLPAMLRRNLKLTAAQTKQLDELQKEVDAKIEKILTADQNKQLRAMRDRRPGMFGGPGPGGGRPGFGRPGGPPPDGPDGGGPPPGGPPDGRRAEPPPPPPEEN
jgi:hypothetical protein